MAKEKNGISKRHENVQIHFLGWGEDDYLPGAVLERDGTMVVDIPGGDGPYHIIGKARGYTFSGTNDHPERRHEVEARWADIGGVYVGIWIEEESEYLFSFKLSAAN